MELSFKSGSSSHQGRRDTMEDTHIALDDVSKAITDCKEQIAFYGVFDGHGGVRSNTTLLCRSKSSICALFVFLGSRKRNL
jgi:serine/threonine protein phosphatase PrpC